jgi:hypothetical protein
MSLPKDWLTQMDNDPMWIITNVQSVDNSLDGVRLLLSWFDDASLTTDQLNEALEEYAESCNIRTALMAVGWGPLACS